MKIKYILLFPLLLLFTLSQAQQSLSITIISDAAESDNHFFEEAIKSEINTLLTPRFKAEYVEIFTGGSAEKIREEIKNTFLEKKTDILIGSRILASEILSSQDEYPVPSIASIQLKQAAAKGEVTANQTSEVFNFTYINSPFNIMEGIEKLQQICRCNEIAVLAPQNLIETGLDAGMVRANDSMRLNWIALEADLSQMVSKIPNGVGGVYILSPMAEYNTGELQSFLDALNRRKLPSFSLLDDPLLALGAYASYSSSDNLKKIPRRIALNVEKIVEGKNPMDLPVNVESFSRQLLINMETVNKTGKYPDWTLLDEAVLININEPYTSRVINLRSAIAEGLQRNMGYQIAEKQTRINRKDVGLARSNYLPQLGVGSTGYFLDQNTVDNSFGTQGEFNWTASASFSQIILSEPALANIAIQKLLYESGRQAQDQSKLDVILEVAQRYFQYLQIKAVAELQNDNVRAINQNLTIALDKEKVGYSGLNDVHRWKTELDLAKADLIETNAQLKSSSYLLNESLNRPIGESFMIPDNESINSLIEELDEVFSDMIQNRAMLDRLADFMVQEAFQNLPEIKQIDLAIAAQERLLKSNRRAFVLPTIGLGAEYNHPIQTVNPGTPPPIPGFEVSINPSWNAGVNLSFPIFNGTARAQQKEKTRIGVLQLQDNKKEVSNLLELQVRSNVQVVNASFNNIRLTARAAGEAEKNVDIVRDYYKSGQVDIITLVDAQNTLLGAQINATNAKYQFMIDYFGLQRSIGYYLFFDTPENRRAFLQKFTNFN